MRTRQAKTIDSVRASPSYSLLNESLSSKRLSMAYVVEIYRAVPWSPLNLSEVLYQGAVQQKVNLSFLFLYSLSCIIKHLLNIRHFVR